MTISLIRTPQISDILDQQHESNRSSYCTLQWRRSQLLVKSSGKLKQPYLPALENQQLLVNCLKHSPIDLVSIDPKVGETWLTFWADACEKAHKPMFLRASSSNSILRQNSQSGKWLLRIIDWIAALVLLLLLTPIMLLLLFLVKLSAPESIFSREWYVGEKGKLFRAIKFSTNTKRGFTLLGYWIQKYSLDHLPQLWNVLRGDMSFIGSRCLTLEAAVQLSLAGQRELNPLPMINSSWQVPAESQLITPSC